MVLQPYLIEPLSTFLASYSSSIPDLFSVFILIAILFVSVKILGYAYRVVMFWITLAFKLVFWGTIIGIGWYVYSVGVENAGRDFGWLWGVIYGFVGDFQEKSKIAAAAYAGHPK